MLASLSFPGKKLVSKSYSVSLGLYSYPRYSCTEVTGSVATEITNVDSVSVTWNPCKIGFVNVVDVSEKDCVALDLGSIISKVSDKFSIFTSLPFEDKDILVIGPLTLLCSSQIKGFSL